jgi:predicted ATPase
VLVGGAMPVMGENTYLPEQVAVAADRLVILSGCSGGGKSTLLAELGRRGLAVYEEPGRQVVKEQLFIGGDALPWADLDGFIALTVSRAIYNLVSAARLRRPAVFDRGIIDQIAGFEQLGRPVPPALAAAAERFPCHRRVFLVPPWPEIFANDGERRHGFATAEEAYEGLLQAYRRRGYETMILPKATVADRADFMLDALGADWRR